MHDDSAYPQPIRTVLEAQARLARCMEGVGSADWMALDLSIGQLKALMLLAGQPDVTISEVAQRLNLGRPAASILVDRLVHLRFVQRTEDASDRRRTRVTLTAEGDELVSRLRQVGRDRYAQWLRAMAPDDLAALARGLEALAAAADVAGASGGPHGSDMPDLSPAPEFPTPKE